MTPDELLKQLTAGKPTITGTIEPLCLNCKERLSKYGCENGTVTICRNPKGGVWTADIKGLTVR